MRLRIILIMLFITALIYSQEDTKKNPTVELPDFVITGTSKISIKKVDKIKPDFVSTISEDFLTPSYSPEEFKIGDFPNPIKSDLSFLNDVNYFKGNIAAGIGLYTIPTVDINYAQPFTNGIIEGRFNGSFTRAYVDNSDKYKTRAGFNLFYWSNIDGDFLPGTQFNVNGNYGTTSLKFFASDNPTQRRSINYGKIEVAVKNDFNKNFLISLILNDRVANISQEKFNENNLMLKGESLIKFSSFNLGVDVDYYSHIIKNLSGDKSGKDFLLLRPIAGFQFTDLIKGSFGWNFSRGAGNTFNAPYASVAIKLDKNLTLFGEFAPTAEFESPGTYLIKNNYLRIDSIGSIYWEKKNAFSAKLKYEYGKYFQIDGGFKYFTTDDYPFFSSSSQAGKFILDREKIDNISPFLDLLFYLGPNGEFYSSLQYNNAIDQNDNNVPYIPNFQLNASYSYKFSPKVKGSAFINYLSKRFADVDNTVSIGDYMDLGLSLVYTFNTDFDFTAQINNILNYKNYYWYGYKEIPLNVILGINYRL
jgi:hypothetical protein